MNVRVRLAEGFASTVFMLAVSFALPFAALAQSNLPGPLPRASLPTGSLSVTGTQTIGPGGCSRFEATVTGQVSGTTDDGGGFDQVSFEVFDEGELRDIDILSIPVGTTASIQVTLRFFGAILGGVPGVGITVRDAPGTTLLLFADPFFPTQVAGPCPLCTEPRAGCSPAGKSSLSVKNNAKDAKDRIVWTWSKGPEILVSELGDPTATTNYALCIHAGGERIEVDLPAGSRWKAKKTGFRFKDSSGLPNGAGKAVVRGGVAGKSKAVVRGKGPNLPDALAPPLSLPVTVQLVNDANDTCFEATYTTAIKNDAKKFVAKAP